MINYRDFIFQYPELRDLGNSIYVPAAKIQKVPSTLKTGPGMKYDKITVSVTMRIYNTYFKEQEELLTTGQFMARLATALMRFVKMPTVSTTSICPFKGEHCWIDGFVKKSKTLNAARKENWFSHVVQQRSNTLSNFYEPFSFPVVLRIHSSSRARGFSHDEGIFQLGDRDIFHAKKALANLTIFELNFNCTSSTLGQKHLSEGSLTRFLELVPNLEALHLGQTGSDDFVPAVRPFDDTLQRLTFPRLIFFSLERAQLLGPAISSFLNRHKGTLEDLSLCRIELSGNKWCRVLEDFRAGHKLQRIHLRILYHTGQPDISLLQPSLSEVMHKILEIFVMNNLVWSPAMSRYHFMSR